MLIAGERRWRTRRLPGCAQIPALLRTSDERSALAEAVVENLQREDLTPLEEAAAYTQLLEDFAMTHEQVGALVGKSRAGGDRTLRLLSLPPADPGMLDETRSRALVTSAGQLASGSPNTARQSTRVGRCAGSRKR